MRSLTILAALLLATQLDAQVVCGSYDADLGTAPDAQGWLLSEFLPGVGSHGVAGGVLAQSSLPFTVTGCSSSTEMQTHSWQIVGTPFDFDDGFVFEAELRIVASQYNANPCESWPRAGFIMAARDATSRNIQLGFGESMIYLANDPYVPFGDPGVAELAFDTVSDFHTYRIEADALGLTLFIDDVPQLSLPHGAPVGSANIVAIGDGTTWANSAAELRGFHAISAQQAGPWEYLGHELAGTHGNPCHTGSGTLLPGDTFELSLDGALENTTGFWVWSFSAANLPFKGGVLVPDPAPPGFIIALNTGPAGSLSVPVVMPLGAPSGLALFWQWWIQDPAGPFGFAASNALSGVVP